jgi:hypothetical protein
LVDGKPSVNQALESSVALGSQAQWLPGTSLTLSKSFDFLPPLSMTNQLLFSRIRE